MVTQSVSDAQRAKPARPLPHREDDREYWTVYQGYPVQRYWSELTLMQKRLQIQAEERAAHAEEFGIYGYC